MARPNPKLEWCIVRVGADMNWWVTEISDEVHWDVDGLGIIDPRQMSHLIDLCDGLRDYGFDIDIIDQSFFAFTIDREVKDGKVRLQRTRDSFLEGDEENALFALPDIMDEEKGPYADFLEQVTRFRVKMLNDLIDFEQKLTIDELEEEIRERQNNDYLEGRSTHFFQEASAILEYVPQGYELEDEESERSQDDEDLDDIPDFEEENIEEDETMKWDEDDEEDDEDDDEEDSEGDRESDDDLDSDDEPEEEPAKPTRRGRPRRKKE